MVSECWFFSFGWCALLVMNEVFIVPNSLWMQNKKYSHMQRVTIIGIWLSPRERAFLSIIMVQICQFRCGVYQNFSILSELTFIQVRIHFHKQFQWTTEMSSVFIKIYKSCVTFSPTCWYLIINKHKELSFGAMKGLTYKHTRLIWRWFSFLSLRDLASPPNKYMYWVYMARF